MSGLYLHQFVEMWQLIEQLHRPARKGRRGA